MSDRIQQLEVDLARQCEFTEIWKKQLETVRELRERDATLIEEMTIAIHKQGDTCTERLRTIEQQLEAIDEYKDRLKYLENNSVTKKVSQDLTRQMADLVAEKHRLGTRLSLADHAVRRLENTVEKREAAMRGNGEVITQQQERIKELEQENEKLKDRNDRQAKTILDLKDYLNEKEQERLEKIRLTQQANYTNEQLHERLERLQKSEDRQINTIKDQANRIRMHHEDKHKLRQEIKELKQEIANFNRVEGCVSKMRYDALQQKTARVKELNIECEGLAAQLDEVNLKLQKRENVLANVRHLTTKPY